MLINFILEGKRPPELWEAKVKDFAIWEMIDQMLVVEYKRRISIE